MENYIDYFGFDLGDGESAVAWVKADTSAEPQMLEICGKKSILTALGEHDEMGTLIGEQAFLADSSRLYVRFKSKFLTDPEIAKDRLTRFAAAVRDELVRRGKLHDPAKSFFFIGCPSGWKEAERREYKEVFLKAGFKNVDVVSESRAAFMFARESGELRATDEVLAKPALIIDAGSSTTDFTFINRLRTQKAYDFGETMLGGGLIDKLLWEKNLSRHPEHLKLGAILAHYPQYEARCELEARKVKEMYFTRRQLGASGGYSIPCESSVKIYYSKPPITVDVTADDCDMEEILNKPLLRLNGQSYLEAYRGGLERFRDELRDTPPEVILLTGGASRMDFIENIAREVFPDAQMLRGAEPEFSIARGLCYALRIDMKTRLFDEDVKALIDSDEVENRIMHALPGLFGEIAPVISDHLIESIATDAFRAWKNEELQTLAEMSDYMRDALAHSLSSGDIRLALQPVTRAWIEALRPLIEKSTDPICAKYNLPLTSLRLPSAMSMDASKIRIGADKLVDLSLLQTTVDVIVATLVASLLGGGGVALLMAGPVGFILSFFIGLLASRLGTNMAMRHMDKWRVPRFFRNLFTVKMFRRSLEGQREKLNSNIEKQLNASLNPPDDSVRTLVRSVSDAIERQLGDLSEQARLLIH
ncbi:MAG: Hsp70 family protein [Christensenellales bacterium]